MEQKSRKIRIFHTNDLHSHFEMMPRIAHFISRKRMECAQDGEEAIFIDLGDHMDRMSMNSEVSRGGVNRDILEASGYHYVTIGNNEGITLTKEELNDLYDGVAFKVIISNLFHKENSTPPSWALPYEILTLKNQYNIGLIGLTVPYMDYYDLLGWEVRTPEQVLPQLVGKLRNQVNMIILLSHLGLAKDREIAEKYPEIRLILGAHSHHFLDRGEWHGETLIKQLGSKGYYMGEIVLEVDHRNHLLSISSFSHPMEEEEQATSILEILDQYTKKAEQELNETVIHLDEPLEISWQEESGLANLLAQSVRNWTKTEISLVNSGLILQSLPPGRVTLERLLTICPHPINPCIVRLSVKDLIQILNEALSPSKMEQQVKGYGFRGKVLGFPALDGCNIIVQDIDKGDKQVTDIQIAGKTLPPTQWISIGTIDMFVFMKPYQALHRIKEVQYILPDFLRHLLAIELRRDGAREESKKKRYIISGRDHKNFKRGEG